MRVALRKQENATAVRHLPPQSDGVFALGDEKFLGCRMPVSRVGRRGRRVIAGYIVFLLFPLPPSCLDVLFSFRLGLFFVVVSVLASAPGLLSLASLPYISTPSDTRSKRTIDRAKRPARTAHGARFLRLQGRIPGSLLIAASISPADTRAARSPTMTAPAAAHHAGAGVGGRSPPLLYLPFLPGSAHLTNLFAPPDARWPLGCRHSHPCTLRRAAARRAGTRCHTHTTPSMAERIAARPRMQAGRGDGESCSVHECVCTPRELLSSLCLSASKQNLVSEAGQRLSTRMGTSRLWV